MYHKCYHIMAVAGRRRRARYLLTLGKPVSSGLTS